jgi:hypothetical protein
MEQGHHTWLLPLEVNVLSRYGSHFISQVQKDCYNDDDDEDDDDDDFNNNTIPVNFQN